MNKQYEFPTIQAPPTPAATSRVDELWRLWRLLEEQEREAFMDRVRRTYFAAKVLKRKAARG